MKNVYSYDCLFCTHVFKWYKRFQNSRNSLEDDPKSGWPKKKNLNELVEKVHEMIAYDVNLIVRWIAEELNTTKDMIHEILTKDLNKWFLTPWMRTKKLLVLNIEDGTTHSWNRL